MVVGARSLFRSTPWESLRCEIKSSLGSIAGARFGHHTGDELHRHAQVFFLLSGHELCDGFSTAPNRCTKPFFINTVNAIMKFESRDGTKCVYSEYIAGRTVRATTVNGPAGAEKLFAIIRQQNGVAASPGIRQDFPTTRRHR
jgi:hypothetical protein